MNARLSVSVALLAGAVLLPGRGRAQQFVNSDPSTGIIMVSTCGPSPGSSTSLCGQLAFDFFAHGTGPFFIHRLYVAMIPSAYAFATPVTFTAASDDFGSPITPLVLASGPSSFFIGFLGPDPVLDQLASGSFDLHLEVPLAGSPSNPFAVLPAFNATAYGPTGDIVFTTTPEPTTLLLLGTGLAALAAGRPRRKGKRAT